MKETTGEAPGLTAHESERASGDWSQVLSASQISTFLACNRKWAWQKIHKMKEPEGLSAQKGTRVHSHLEGYLNSGEWSFGTDPETAERDREEVEIAIAAAAYLPAPGECRSEREFWLKLDGVTFMGKIDVSQPGKVFDLKTKKNLRWAMSPAELEWDVQAGLYAIADQLETGGDATELSWVYSQSEGGKKAKPVSTVMHKTQALKLGRAIANVGKRMLAIKAEGKRALDLAPNLETCSAYGGCPFQAECNLTPGERVRIAMQKEKPMNIIDQLKAELGTNPVPPKVEATTKAQATKVADPINPPEKNELANLLLTETDAPEKPKGKKGKKPAKDIQAEGPQTRGGTWVEEEGLPGLGVLPSADTLSDPLAELAALGQAGVSAPAPKVDTLEKELARAENLLVRAEKLVHAEAKVSKAITSGFALYVDCFSPDQNITLLDSLIERAKKIVNDELKVSDYRFVKYGAGPGALAQALVEIVEAEMPSELVLSTASPEGMIVLSALSARASKIVRSFR